MHLSSVADRPGPSGIGTASVATSSTARTTVTTKSAHVTDTGFRENVLSQYKVVVENSPETRHADWPYTHFGASAPIPADCNKEAIVRWYQEQYQHADSSIWVPLDEADAEFVRNEYKTMMDSRQTEAKFSFYSKVAFLREDVSNHPSCHERNVRAVYTLEWGPKPNEDLLCPPLLAPLEHGRPFAFENRPDLVFWLSLSQFNPNVRDHVNVVTYVHPQWQIAGPYFTVEFKRDDDTLDAAVNQVAAAAAISLYNRVPLRVRALRENGYSGSWSSKNFKHIAHYGIAFTGDQADIYQALPKLVDTEPLAPGMSLDALPMWSGCVMKRLVRTKLTSTRAVRMLRAWVNEIQNWGLGTYSKYFENDVKRILSKGPQPVAEGRQ